MSDNRTATLGGIIKHNKKGVGFKVSFQNKKQAQYYKEMMMYILKSDEYMLQVHHGYYDKKER